MLKPARPTRVTTLATALAHRTVPAVILMLALQAGSGALSIPAQAADPPAQARPAAAPAPAAPQADLVLKGGAVYTVDDVRSWAGAVAIKGEKILYVGSDKGASKYTGPKTRVVHLEGKMVLPGFQDSHVHPISGGVAMLYCALFDLGGKEAYLKAVTAYAAKNPKAAWIRGDGWDMSIFPKGIPRREDLDAIVPDRPVYLDSKDGHSAWVNSKALQIAGITRETPDPPSGRIDRDADGEPVGSLQESAMELVTRHLPRVTLEERRAGLREALKMLNGLGITSVQDASVELAGSSVYRGLDVYRSLDARGELSARVVASLKWNHDRGEAQIPDLIRARREYTRGRVRAHTVKIFQDGVIESKTAALLRPYRGRDGGHGMALEEPEVLKRIVTRLDKEGFQVHFHAIGDAAIRHCLDAVGAALRANGARDARHHISHIELFHPDDIPRFRELGVVANFQPLWARGDSYITDLTLPILDPETHRWLYPIASLLKSGAVVAFGSDWSVSSANPLDEMEVAVTRTGWAGEEQDLEPFLPEERIDLRDAIAAFTINAAYVNFQEERTGSIEAGKLADLIVLDRNLFAIPPREISESRVLLTLLGGKPVHGKFSDVARAGAGR